MKRPSDGDYATFYAGYIKNVPDDVIKAHENDYIRESNYSKRNYYDIVDELRKVRESNLLMFKSFSEEILDRKGVANNSEVTVRALLFIIAGHEIHHINIVKER